MQYFQALQDLRFFAWPSRRSGFLSFFAAPFRFAGSLSGFICLLKFDPCVAQVLGEHEIIPLVLSLHWWGRLKITEPLALFALDDLKTACEQVSFEKKFWSDFPPKILGKLILQISAHSCNQY